MAELEKTSIAGATGTGAALIVSGMAVIGLIDNFVVEIARHGGLWQFHAMRTAMAVPVLVLVAWVAGARLWPRRPLAVAARALLLASAMMIYFASIPVMPIALVVAGLFTSPVFVLLISALVYGTRVGPVRIGAVVLGFAGALLILNPTGAAFDLRFVAPVGAGLLYAMAAVATRRYCAEETTLSLLIAFFLALGGLACAGLVLADGDMSAPFHLRAWVAPGGPLLFWTAVQAFGSILGIFLLTRAYQVAEPSFMAVYEFSLLIFVSFWAWMLYGQTISAQAGLGMCLVVLGGSMIALRSGTE